MSVPAPSSRPSISKLISRLSSRGGSTKADSLMTKRFEGLMKEFDLTTGNSKDDGPVTLKTKAAIQRDIGRLDAKSENFQKLKIGLTAFDDSKEVRAMSSDTQKALKAVQEAVADKLNGKDAQPKSTTAGSIAADFSVRDRLGIVSVPLYEDMGGQGIPYQDADVLATSGAGIQKVDSTWEDAYMGPTFASGDVVSSSGEAIYEPDPTYIPAGSTSTDPTDVPDLIYADGEGPPPVPTSPRPMYEAVTAENVYGTVDDMDAELPPLPGAITAENAYAEVYDPMDADLPPLPGEGNVYAEVDNSNHLSATNPLYDTSAVDKPFTQGISNPAYFAPSKGVDYESTGGRPVISTASNPMYLGVDEKGATYQATGGMPVEDPLPPLPGKAASDYDSLDGTQRTMNLPGDHTNLDVTTDTGVGGREIFQVRPEDMYDSDASSV